MSEEDLFDEVYFEEPTTPMEAVSLVRAIIRIKKQSLKLLSWAVQDMHDSIFEEEDNN